MTASTTAPSPSIDWLLSTRPLAADHPLYASWLPQ